MRDFDLNVITVQIEKASIHGKRLRVNPLTYCGEGERLLLLPVRRLGVSHPSEVLFGREMSLHHVGGGYWGTVANEGERSVEGVRCTGVAVLGGGDGGSVDLFIH